MTTPTLDTTSATTPAGVAPIGGSPGIAFRETMAGPFALGATEPEAGARAGAAAGTSLWLRVAIHVPDLAAFLADREHAGRIAGTVDFAPLGHGMRAERGDFRLFAPAPAGTT